MDNINVKDTADAVKGIVEAVPIYQDLLQPAVKELGKGLHTLSKTVHIALSPISAMIWGYDQIKDYVQTSLEHKLKNVSPENIIPPDLSIAGPALEALRYTGHKEELREMFANLLATSMDKEKAMKAHPSFVEIIKQINSDEAKMLKTLRNGKNPLLSVQVVVNDEGSSYETLTNFSLLPYLSECHHPELGSSYIENLNRLKLIDTTYQSFLTDEKLYDPLIAYPLITQHVNVLVQQGKKVDYSKGVFERTNFGQLFYESCILEK